MMELRDHGVSLEDITRELLDDGVKQFTDAFEALYAALDRRRAELSEGEKARAAQ